LPVSVNYEVVMGCTDFDLQGILCEKPITDSLEHADEMVAACRARKIKFGCGDLDRNLPDYWKAKAIIDSGELGEVVAIDMHAGSSNEWDIQGLSITRMFAGDSEVAWVTGWVTDDPFSDHDQGQAGYIRFANGIEAFRHTNANAKNGIEVLCTKGSFYTDFMYLKMWKLKDPAARPSWSNGMEEVAGVFKKESQHEGSGVHGEDGWRWAGNRNVATVQSMIDAIENDVEPTGSGETSRKCLEIAIALRESHRRGMMPVQLPLEDRGLKIIPPMSRWLNKKETMPVESYRQSIGNWKLEEGAGF
jgi:predicted dehydrogenase